MGKLYLYGDLRFSANSERLTHSEVHSFSGSVKHLHFDGKFYTHHLKAALTLAAVPPRPDVALDANQDGSRFAEPRTSGAQGPKGPRLKKFFTLDQLIN